MNGVAPEEEAILISFGFPELFMSRVGDHVCSLEAGGSR
jgi:hypothetical protein